MTMINRENGVASGRLDSNTLKENFLDLHPALDSHAAVVAADRCYFCHDAPCITACPTSIDIPLFIRQISTGTEVAAAKTIFDQNILGGMCARVCPTETLCEQACVRETAEARPVEIGRLQRFATDTALNSNAHPYKRASDTGKSVAVVGAGPAGLACAHRLAMLGHSVVVFDARPKGGGLNEFGIAAYKSTNDFAQKELAWLLGIGGIEMRFDQSVGETITLETLQNDFDAVFLGIGLSAANNLNLGDGTSTTPAVDFIADLRQSTDLSSLPIGRRIVVIGGGMTAIDAGVQAKLLGAEDVSIVYRRSQDEMAASRFEQDLAQQKGVRLICNAAPVSLSTNEGLTNVAFAYTKSEDGKLVTLDETFSLEADQVFTAIGQTLDGSPEGLRLKGNKIEVDENGKTSVSGIWAGGDCACGGDDLTVTAVAEGRDAAINIDANLRGAL
ncbi:NAD(P)-dependent oxidoreductase [Cognatishimia sp. WU-CL00825]|uniref:NAD(P)-dependent oxidoreductase n=1 Tax=Cognatishimia sp. WU-CL00825 TaxID=3127658 RepID=UPI00310BE6FF